MRTTSMLVTAAVAGVVCGTVGYIAGANAAPPASAAAPKKAVNAVPKAARAVRGLVCATTRAPSVKNDSCEAEALRARWCESELAEARRERSAVRQQWPDEDSVEAPERWANTVEEALETCAIGADLELVDCTEYPCTAALRPTTPPSTPEAFKAGMERMMREVRACTPLRTAFNLDADTVERGLDVYRLDAKCESGREDFFVLTALAPSGAAFELLDRDRNDQQERDFNRWMYRRADDLSALWPCE